MCIYSQRSYVHLYRMLTNAVEKMYRMFACRAMHLAANAQKQEGGNSSTWVRSTTRKRRAWVLLYGTISHHTTSYNALDRLYVYVYIYIYTHT